MSRDSSLLNLLLKMGKESHNNRKTKERDASRKRVPEKDEKKSSCNVSESSKQATTSSSGSRSRQKRTRVISDSSSDEDFLKTSSKKTKPTSDSCSSNAETDLEDKGVSQLSDVLIQHGKKNVGGADNKPTSCSNKVQKIQMPLDKLVVNVKKLDEKVLHPYDLKRFQEWNEKKSKEHPSTSTIGSLPSETGDNQKSELIKKLEAELMSKNDVLASKNQEFQKLIETSQKNELQSEKQAKDKEKVFAEQMQAKEKSLQETDDKLQQMEGAKKSQDQELQNLKGELLKKDNELATLKQQSQSNAEKMEKQLKNNDKIIKVEKENKTLQLKVDAYMSQYKTAQDKLKQQEFHNKKEKDKYDRRITEIETDLNKTKKERDQLNDNIKDFNETTLILKENLKVQEGEGLSQALQKKFEEGKLQGLKVMQLQKSCNVMQNKIKKLELAKNSDISEMDKKRTQNLMAVNAELRDLNLKHEQDILSWKKQNKEISEQNNLLLEDSKRIPELEAKLRGKYGLELELEKEKTLKNEIQIEKNHLLEVNKKQSRIVDTLSKEVKEGQEEKAKYQKDNLKTKNDLENLLADFQNLKNENAKLRGSSSMEFQTVKNQNLKLKEEIAETKRIMSSMVSSEEITKLEKELALKSEELDTANSEKSELLKNMQLLRQDKEQSDYAAYEQVFQKLKETTEASAKREKEFELKEKENAELKKTLQVWKHELAEQRRVMDATKSSSKDYDNEMKKKVDSANENAKKFQEQLQMERHNSTLLKNELNNLRSKHENLSKNHQAMVSSEEITKLENELALKTEKIKTLELAIQTFTVVNLQGKKTPTSTAECQTDIMYTGTVQGQLPLNENTSSTQQIPAGTSSLNDRLHPAAHQQPHQTLPRMNMKIVPLSNLLQNTQNPSNSTVPNSTSVNYPPSNMSNVVPTSMLHYRHTNMATVSVQSAQNLHHQLNVDQSSSPASQASQIVVQQQSQRQQRQSVQQHVRTSAPQQNIPTNNRQSVQRQRVANNMPQNTRTRPNLSSTISQNVFQPSQGGTQIVASGQNNLAHILPQMIASGPRNMPPVQIVPNPTPLTTATTMSRIFPQTVSDPRSLSAQRVQTIAPSSQQQNNAQMVMEAQKTKALAYFGEMLNKSKYNEEDRQWCREHRAIFAAAMEEMGNDEGNSLNELFRAFLPQLEEDYIPNYHPRIIERKEVLRLALNMAFLDVFQIAPDYDAVEC